MFRRTLVATLAALTLLVGLVAGTALAARPVWVFTTQLRGAAEVPGPGDEDAKGHATIKVRPGTDEICWVVNWNHVDGTVVAAHIHGQATENEPAGVVFPLFVMTEFGSNGNDRGCATSEVADDIVAAPELYYVNVHSLPSFAAGAIRGQLD